MTWEKLGDIQSEDVFVKLKLFQGGWIPGVWVEEMLGKRGAPTNNSGILSKSGEPTKGF